MDQDQENSVSDEVIVMLNLRFKSGSVETVLEKMIPSIRLTRSEPGNNEFQMFSVKGSEDTFIVYERWKDRAALEQHWQQPHTKEVLTLFAEHLAMPFSDAKDVTHLARIMDHGK